MQRHRNSGEGATLHACISTLLDAQAECACERERAAHEQIWTSAQTALGSAVYSKLCAGRVHCFTPLLGASLSK
eukprot:11774642-Alexandrium_andersonii.AAC.1